MKGIVDYKHPKKMKKRRQLDALVDTVKLPRSRKNSASAQELLDCHSDSSEIDDLNLQQSSSKRKRCCICHSIAARIGLFMVTMACLTTCVAIIWVQWHLRHELETLREQITSVQNSESVSPSLLKMQSQLAEVNKSMINMKTGPYGLQEITNTITYIKTKLKELNDANLKLQTSVSASSEVLGLPAKMTALSTMLATLGSDFKDFMKMQTSKFAELEKRVTTIETEAKDLSKDPQRSLDSQASQMLTQELSNYNITLRTGLQSVNQELERQSVRINTLEEFTSHSLTSAASVNNTIVKDMVTKFLEEKMPFVMNTSESALEQETLPDKLSYIVQRGEELNETLLALRSELDNLVGRVDKHDSALSNLTKVVDDLKNGESTKLVDSSRVEKSMTNVDEVSVDKITTAPSIHIDKINNYQDILKIFDESHNVNNQLDIKTLNNLMNTTLPAEQLKHFDADNNDLYSKEELAMALGFHKNPR